MGKGNGLIVKFGMMFMVQTTVSAEIPMVVVVEIYSNSHWTLLFKELALFDWLNILHLHYLSC
jgi:hypothetical protein